jgi:hypothetical protein
MFSNRVCNKLPPPRRSPYLNYGICILCGEFLCEDLHREIIMAQENNNDCGEVYNSNFDA